MKVACLQMNMVLGAVDANYASAARLIKEAMVQQPDVLVLPETWNSGFFPKEKLAELSDQDGARTKELIG